MFSVFVCLVVFVYLARDGEGGGGPFWEYFIYLFIYIYIYLYIHWYIYLYIYLIYLFVYLFDLFICTFHNSWWCRIISFVRVSRVNQITYDLENKEIFEEEEERWDTVCNICDLRNWGFDRTWMACNRVLDLIIP